MDNTENLLEVRNLSVDFRVDRKTVLHAVRNLSFSLRQGETLGILGESGCGKSVTCMSVLQLNPLRTTSYPTGEILFRGQDLLRRTARQMKEIRGNEIAMIFQEPMTAMNPLFTVGDQLMEAIRVHNPRMEKSEARQMCLEGIRKVRIPNPERIMKSYPFTLSGGMLQRAMIAMAMLTRPKLLICDEPTTALDVTIQAQVLDLMNTLKEENHTSILFVTHDLGVIHEMADRVMVMYGGRKCEEGDAAEVLKTLDGTYPMVFMDAAKGQYSAFLPEVLRLLAPGGLLITDNVLQDGDLLESRYAVTRRDRTIHARMRDYLYELMHSDLLDSTILNVGDGMALSVKKST